MNSRRLLAACVLAACAATAACSSKYSTPTAPSGTASVQATSSPNPAPWSGAPITAVPECAGFANTWFFNTVLTETTGVAVTLTSQVNVLDGAERPAVISSILVSARGTTTLNRQFCFAGANQHTVQSTFTGNDANGHSITVATPIVTLSAR